MLRAFISASALAFGLGCAAPAQAERFALEYDGHAFGLAPVGKVTFDFTIDRDGYDVVSTVRSGGVLKMAGKVRGWELMRERQLSPSFVERFYILSADAPIFYRFLFYKVDGAWTIYSITFNDQYDKMPGLASAP